MKRMVSFQSSNSLSGTHAVKLILLLVCIAGAATSSASETSGDTLTPAYVPAQNISCRYGLSAVDLQSVDSAPDHARRPDVIVRVSIDTRGQISDAVVEQSSGSATVDNIAAQASRRAECKPSYGADGKLVPVETNFAFSLAHIHINATPTDQTLAAASNNVMAAAGSRASVVPSAINTPFPGTPFPSTALPFEFGKPVDQAALARLGIVPGSSQAKILDDWAKKLVSDPDIANFFAIDADAGRKPLNIWSRVVGMLDGMARISTEDREQLTAMTTRALDNAPDDCDGVKNLQVIASRYALLGSETDEQLKAQLQAIFDLFKQSAQTTPVPSVTAGQQLQGQLAVARSIADALKRDPAQTEDLGLLMRGRSSELSRTAWCKAARFYRHAFDNTPQPLRDWAVLGELDNQRRSAAVMLAGLKRLMTPTPFTSQPKLFDYAELVRQRIRSNLVWTGRKDGLETVVKVECSSHGNLLSARIVQSSGDSAWDAAALNAVKRSDPMPLDESGRTPLTFSITLRPGI